MLLGFDNCVGPYDITTSAAMSAWRRWSGDVPTASTTGAYRCKYSLQHDNSVGLRCDHYIPSAPPDTYRWFTMDHYIATSETVSGGDIPEWMILTSSYDYGAGVTQLGVTWERGAGVSRGKLHLVKFFFANGAPAWYTVVASQGAYDYDMVQRNRLQVRSIYNSGADTMDCEVWWEDTVGDPGNSVKVIDASGIDPITVSDSGTADAAVTTTTGPPGTLTDTRESWDVDALSGAVITCNGKTMTITTNTATTVTGTGGWSGGGNPGDGNSWSLVGTEKPWEQDQYWNITQSERTGGKGGTDFTTHTCNYIWNDERAGNGPSAQPSLTYAVPFHQINADTDDAARDDWIGGGTAPTAPLTAKYNYADDNNGADDPGDDYVMVDQSLTDEQEFAVANINDLGSASVDAIAVVAEIREETANGGRNDQLEATLHCTVASAWTPTIFNSMMVIFRRLKLDGDAEELRLYNAYVLAAGDDIDMPAANGAGADNADETPTGTVLQYTGTGLRPRASGASDPAYWHSIWFWPGDDIIGQTLVQPLAKAIVNPSLPIMKRIPIAAVVAAVRRIFCT
jgi:hypothetical protein